MYSLMKWSMIVIRKLLIVCRNLKKNSEDSFFKMDWQSLKDASHMQ
jgi:hypothetical protein